MNTVQWLNFLLICSVLTACQSQKITPINKLGQPIPTPVVATDNTQVDMKQDALPESDVTTINNQWHNKVYPPIKPRLILIHGLYQSPLIMMPLASKLKKAGYNVYSFNYDSVIKTLPQHSEKLNAWLTKHHNKQQPIYLVGHSLGGLVIRDFISRYPQWKIANVVQLGTPNLGSVSADFTKKTLPFMINKSYKDGLDGKVANLEKDSVTLGIIAGSKPIGISTPLLGYHNYKNRQKNASKDDQTAHDGIVYVHETRLPNATEHMLFPTTHSGLLFKKEVARQTIHFLQNGTFSKAPLQ